MNPQAKDRSPAGRQGRAASAGSGAARAPRPPVRTAPGEDEPPRAGEAEMRLAGLGPRDHIPSESSAPPVGGRSAAGGEFMAVTNDEVLLAFAGDEMARSLLGRHLVSMVRTLAVRLSGLRFHIPEGSPCRMGEVRRRLTPGHLFELVHRALCSYRPDQPEALLKALGIELFWSLRQAPTPAAALPIEKEEFLDLWLKCVPQQVPEEAALSPVDRGNYAVLCDVMRTHFRLSAIPPDQVALVRAMGEPETEDPFRDRIRTHLPERLLLTSIAIVGAFPKTSGFEMEDVVGAICRGLAKYDAKNGGLEETLEAEVWRVLVVCVPAGSVSREEFARQWQNRDAYLSGSSPGGRGSWTWIHDISVPHEHVHMPRIKDALEKFRAERVGFPLDLLLGALLDISPARHALARLSFEYLHRIFASKFANLSPSERLSAYSMACTKVLDKLPTLKNLHAYASFLGQTAVRALMDVWQDGHGPRPDRDGESPPGDSPDVRRPFPTRPTARIEDVPEWTPASPEDRLEADKVAEVLRAVFSAHLRTVRRSILQAMRPQTRTDGKPDPAPPAGSVVRAWLRHTADQGELVRRFDSSDATIHNRIHEGLNRVRAALVGCFAIKQITQVLPDDALRDTVERWLGGEEVKTVFRRVARTDVRPDDVCDKDAKLYVRDLLRFLLGWAPTTDLFWKLTDLTEPPRG